MNYNIIKYPEDKSYHALFHHVVQFLNKQNEKHEFLHYHWSRWEWMFARDGFKESDLSQISLFTNDKQEIKGLLSFEDEPNLWFLTYENDINLKKQMVNYLIEHHPTDDVIVPKDLDMIKLLEHNNYEQMDWIDPIAKFTKTSVDLPKVEGYEIRSLAEDYRLDQIH